MLILAREEVVAALLGLMVEVSGFQPKFTGRDESAESAVASGRLHAVLIDYDHPEFNETLVGAIRSSGARPILFSPSRMHAEVKRLAQLYSTESFTLPTGPATFSRILGS